MQCHVDNGCTSSLPGMYSHTHQKLMLIQTKRRDGEGGMEGGKEGERVEERKERGRKGGVSDVCLC